MNYMTSQTHPSIVKNKLMRNQAEKIKHNSFVRPSFSCWSGQQELTSKHPPPIDNKYNDQHYIMETEDDRKFTFWEPEQVRAYYSEFLDFEKSKQPKDDP